MDRQTSKEQNKSSVPVRHGVGGLIDYSLPTDTLVTLIDCAMDSDHSLLN